MTEMLGVALVEGARILGDTKKEQARYAYLTGRQQTAQTPAPKAEEFTIPGVELKNYVNRSEVGEDGKHVLVVEHSERIEKKFVPTPPLTVEELAAERAQKRYLVKVYGAVASVAVVVLGVVVIAERRPAKVVLSTEE